MKYKRITTWVFSIISIICLLYYTVKYYHDKILVFKEGEILGWTVLMCILLALLVLGLANNREIINISRKMINVENQNTKLIELILKYIDTNENNCDEILTTLLNSREINLDIYNKIKNGETDNDKLV